MTESQAVYIIVHTDTPALEGAFSTPMGAIDEYKRLMDNHPRMKLNIAVRIPDENKTSDHWKELMTELREIGRREGL